MIQIVEFAPCSGDNPMSATIFSYNGGITVGFSTDAGLIPDPDVLAGCVQDDLTAIQAATGPAAARRPHRRRGTDPSPRQPRSGP